MGTPKIQALPAEAERRARVACPHHQDQSRALRALAASTCETAGCWEPDEPRGSRPVLGERGGEIPPRHSTENPCSSPTLRGNSPLEARVRGRVTASASGSRSIGAVRSKRGYRQTGRGESCPTRPL